MNITKKFLSVLTATICAATASVCGMSVYAEDSEVQDTYVDGYFTYKLIDYNFDGNKDYAMITNVDSSAAEVTIPKVLDGYGVQEIAPNAFLNCTNLTSIDANDDNPYFIGKKGVLYSKDETTLVCHPSAHSNKRYEIPSTVEVISDYAFANCVKIANVTVPTSVKIIGNGAFSGCKALAKEGIKIPSSVESVGQDAFDGTELLDYQIRNSEGPLYYADSWVIYCNKDITNISEASGNAIKAGTTGISGGALSACSELSKLEIPASVLYVGDYAFADCTDLSVVTIPESVKTVGDYAFAGCSSIVELPVPNSISLMGAGVFKDCTKLAEINIPTSIEILRESSFENCSNLLNIKIPANVTTIEQLAFKNCASLKKVEILNSEAVITDSPMTFSNSETTYEGEIHGFAGSTAEKHANTYSITFVSLTDSEPDLPTSTSEKGDANADGKVNVRDAAFIASKIAKGQGNELPDNADFNSDSKVNVRDAAAIAVFVAGGK